MKESSLVYAYFQAFLESYIVKGLKIQQESKTLF